MTTAATISARLVLDSSDYDDGLSKAGKKADDFGQKWKDVGSKLSTVGRNMTAFVTVPIIGMGAAAVNAASDLNETKNKIDVIFGDMSKEITKWSETSATALGQSQTQALDAASNFAIFGKAANLAGNDLVKFSEQNVTLASDLASFFNTNPEEAITAIGAAYRGESEPIRKYGVLINEAAVKTKALEMGLISEGEALSQQNRILAVNALIMDQTTAAQGDFARTSDGLANSTRILQAQLKDEAASIGQQLLPYALKAVTFFGDLIKRFDQLSPATKKWIMILIGVAAVAGPLLMIVGSIITAIGAIIPVITAVGGAIAAVGAPIILIVLAIVAAIALLYLAWTNNWGGIRDKFAAFVAWFQPVWDKIWKGALQIFDFFKAQFQTLVEAFQAAASGDWYTFGEKLREIWVRLWAMMIALGITAWNQILAGIKALIASIVSFFQNTDWGSVGRSIVQGIVRGMEGLRDWALGAIKNFAKAMAGTFNGFFGIKSPSTWAEERAAYIRQGFEKEWSKNPISMSPTPVLASMPTPTLSVSSNVAAQTSSNSSTNDSATNNFDYDRFARALSQELAKRKI